MRPGDVVRMTDGKETYNALVGRVRNDGTLDLVYIFDEKPDYAFAIRHRDEPRNLRFYWWRLEEGD